MVYVIQRLLQGIPVLLGVITISFFVTILVPGDPLAGLLPENPTIEQYERAAQEFGLDRPPHVQLLRYIERTVQGDFGRSLRTRQPVLNNLIPAFKATIELAIVAFLLTCVFGVTLGVVAALRENSALDHILSIVSLGGVAAPVFWTALMVQLIFYGQLNWLPAGGRIDQWLILVNPVPQVSGFYLIDSLLADNYAAFWSSLVHMALPSMVLAYRGSGLVMRVTRAAMLEVLQTQYIQTARSIGVGRRRIVLKYALKNALVPILTVLGLAFGQLLQGSILVEAVFNWPGLGLYTVQSIVRLDYPGVIGASILITVAYVAANLVVDMLYAVVDPRLRGVQ